MTSGVRIKFLRKARENDISNGIDDDTHAEESDSTISDHRGANADHTVSNRVFVSYRRDDSADITGRIHDRLSAHFGSCGVFRDVDSISVGRDFREEAT